MALKINGTTVKQFCSQDFSKSAWPFHRPGDIGRRVVEVLLKGLIGKESLCAAGAGGVLHEGSNAHIAHQQGYSRLLLCRCMHRITLIGQHVRPVILRLGEVSTLRCMIVSHLIFRLPLPAQRPLVIIHHLCNGRSNAPAVGVTRVGVERI